MFYVNNLGVAMSEFEAVYKDYVKNRSQSERAVNCVQPPEFKSYSVNPLRVKLTQLQLHYKQKFNRWLFSAFMKR